MNEPLNRQQVLSFLDDVTSGNIEGALARCSDDIDFLTHAPIDLLPHMGHHRGKPELAEMWNTIGTRYSSVRYEIPMILADGDKVAAYLRMFLCKRSNQRIMQFDAAVFYTLRDGRITQIREIIDSFDLVQQLYERDVAAILVESGAKTV